MILKVFDCDLLSDNLTNWYLARPPSWIIPSAALDHIHRWHHKAVGVLIVRTGIGELGIIWSSINYIVLEFLNLRDVDASAHQQQMVTKAEVPLRDAALGSQPCHGERHACKSFFWTFILLGEDICLPLNLVGCRHKAVVDRCAECPAWCGFRTTLSAVMSIGWACEWALWKAPWCLFVDPGQVVNRLEVVMFVEFNIAEEETIKLECLQHFFLIHLLKSAIKDRPRLKLVQFLRRDHREPNMIQQGNLILQTDGAVLLCDPAFYSQEERKLICHHQIWAAQNASKEFHWEVAPSWRSSQPFEVPGQVLETVLLENHVPSLYCIVVHGHRSVNWRIMWKDFRQEPTCLLCQLLHPKPRGHPVKALCWVEDYVNLVGV